LYAQVIKKRRRWRLVSVVQRIVYGTLTEAERRLKPTGWGINTAFVGRLNLTIRQACCRRWTTRDHTGQKRSRTPASAECVPALL
jgi:hypothetical protein